MTPIELVCFHHAGPHASLGRGMAAWLAYLLAQQRISCGMEPVVVSYRAPHLPVAQELIL
jgi:hypothetical protein